MEHSNKKYKAIGISLATLSLVGLGALTVYETNATSPTVSVADTATQSQPAPIVSQPAVAAESPTPAPSTQPLQHASTYADGTYSATGTYMSPGGLDSVAVTLTVKNDVVTSVAATPAANDGTSRRYQAKFLSGYKSFVVGKDIASIHLTTVSGSSLTPIGFNEALAKIKAEAKA